MQAALSRCPFPLQNFVSYETKFWQFIRKYFLQFFSAPTSSTPSAPRPAATTQSPP